MLDVSVSMLTSEIEICSDRYFAIPSSCCITLEKADDIDTSYEIYSTIMALD